MCFNFGRGRVRGARGDAHPPVLGRIRALAEPGRKVPLHLGDSLNLPGTLTGRKDRR